MIPLFLRPIRARQFHAPQFSTVHPWLVSVLLVCDLLMRQGSGLLGQM